MADKPDSENSGHFKLEPIISTSILLLLAAIAVLIYFQQFAFDEKKFKADVIQAGANAPSALREKIILSSLSPETYAPMTGTEYFDAGTLSDKINGKADLYLESGFTELISLRLVHREDTRLWFEFFLYNMETPVNAFSVYSTQKRKGVSSLDITRFAYSTENAVFLVHGDYYVEIIAADQSNELLAAMKETAGNFVDRHAADSLEMAELSYFPKQNLDPESISMILHNAFGFEKFNNVFTGSYQMDTNRLTAFISVRTSPQEAESLANAYAEFLSELMDSSPLSPETDHIPVLRILDVFGEYEMVFSAGPVLAGIHASADKREGEMLAVQIYDNINRQLK